MSMHSWTEMCKQMYKGGLRLENHACAQGYRSLYDIHKSIA